MKKLTFLILMFAAIACTKEDTKPVYPVTKCTTCTELYTQVKSTYCGTIADVNTFKQTLIEMGAAQGQVWTCKDN